MRALIWLLAIISPCINAQDLNKYIPVEIGFCEDVGLRCASMIPIDTPMFYAVFSDEGKLIAITKIVGKKETTVWGKLPLKKNEVQL